MLKPFAPITQISFNEALEFAESLSAKTQSSYRIPSEAEWEYACRAGVRTRYSFGDSIDQTQAAFGLGEGPSEAGTYSANGYGLYDMHGNVREWTSDLWHESFYFTPLDGSPAIDGHGSMRVVRGGSWYDDVLALRCSARMRATQTSRSNLIGFRLARALA